MDKDQIMNEIYKHNKAEIDRSINDTHEMSKDLYQPSGMTREGNMKFLGRIPMVIYAKMEQIYGRDCWNDDKFIDSFFRAYSRFKISARP